MIKWSYKKEDAVFYVINHLNEYHGRVATEDTAKFFSNAMNEYVSIQAENKKLTAENSILREALGWIVGFDGNQHTTKKAQEALNKTKGS